MRANNYAHILTAFINHWTLINEKLATLTPAAAPLVIGPITLAELQSRLGQIEALTSHIDEGALTRLGVMRAERELIFGDVREDDRAPDSFLGRAVAYRTEILTEFAGTPLAQTVPRLFPASANAKLPKFAFNFRASGAQVTLWWQMPDAVADAAVIYLKEGAFEATHSIPLLPPLIVIFDGVDTQGDLDDVELRDATGVTVAEGRYDATLMEPR